MRVVYVKHALRDVERIANFRSDAELAAEAIDLITEAVELLARHPYMGRPVRGVLRELVISQGQTGFVALYRLANSRVEILRVRHQREAGFG